MSFKDEEWEARYEIMGDVAETAFREHAARRELGHVKYGLDRPPVDLSRTPTFVRYAPDFLTDIGLVEVQGCGKDQLFKFKHDKLTALRQWHRHSHVHLWLWNQPLGDWRMIPFPQLETLCRLPQYTGRRAAYRPDGMFDGTKPYAAVPWVELI